MHRNYVGFSNTIPAFHHHREPWKNMSSCCLAAKLLVTDKWLPLLLCFVSLSGTEEKVCLHFLFNNVINVRSHCLCCFEYKIWGLWYSVGCCWSIIPCALLAPLHLNFLEHVIALNQLSFWFIIYYCYCCYYPISLKGKRGCRTVYTFLHSSYYVFSFSFP